jgi:ABC-type sugar transport system permease subunit
MASVAQPYSQPGTNPPSWWDSVRQGVRASGVPWLFIAPALIVMLFITFTPQIYQIFISFQEFRAVNLGGQPATYIGLDNYRRVLVDGLNVPNYAFLPLLGFNIMWTLVNVAFHAGIGVAVAIALNGKIVLGRRIYRALFVLPWALPAYITALIWNNLWQQNNGGFNLLIGSINETLGTAFATNTDWLGSLQPPLDLRGLVPYLIIGVGIVVPAWLIRRLMRKGLTDKATGKIAGERVIVSLIFIVILGAAAIGTLLDLVSNNGLASNSAVQLFDRAGAPVLAFYAVLIANIWLGWPFMMVVATGALQSIPPDLYEAADVDGASRWTQFTKITLPMIRPAMVPAIMLGTIWTFNQFNVIFFITGGNPRGQTDLLITQAYKLIQQEQLYGAAAAFSIVVFFVLLVITIINNRITRATKSFDEA